MQRLKEIYTLNIREIKAPFEYQETLLNKEVDDVIIAMTEATSDVTDAFNDMLERLDRLYDDKVALLNRESSMVEKAIARAVVDQKDLCAVLRALRVDFTDNIICERDQDATKTFYYADEADTEWRIYEGIFDDFHYDIGHGKGVGEGTVDAAPVVDGFGPVGSAPGVVGDS